MSTAICEPCASGRCDDCDTTAWCEAISFPSHCDCWAVTNHAACWRCGDPLLEQSCVDRLNHCDNCRDYCHICGPEHENEGNE